MDGCGALQEMVDGVTAHGEPVGDAQAPAASSIPSIVPFQFSTKLFF
jgi:hypothetical protein